LQPLIKESNEPLDKHCCTNNITRVDEEKENALNKDLDNSNGKTPTHQDKQKNQKRKQPNYDWHQVDQ